MQRLMHRQKWIFTVGLALLFFVMVLFTRSVQSSHSIQELYIFGDSLSDVGNSFQATSGFYPPSPTYFQGRFSNGRVWVEYLADDLHCSGDRVHNFAYGGATTGNDFNNLAPSVLAQIQSFTQKHPSISPDALYVIWAGANDYLQGRHDAALSVANIMQAITDLVNGGAQKLLVANLPDLGELPATRTSSKAADLSRLTQVHNQDLRRSLKQLNQQRTELQIATLDAHSLYHNAMTHPNQFGFKNVTTTCLSGSHSCPRPDQFLFWDGIHPTTMAHRILGDAAVSVLETDGLFDARSLSSN